MWNFSADHAKQQYFFITVSVPFWKLLSDRLSILPIHVYYYPDEKWRKGFDEMAKWIKEVFYEKNSIFSNFCGFNSILLSFQKVCRINFFSWMSEHDITFYSQTLIGCPDHCKFCFCWRLFETVLSNQYKQS